MCLKIIYNMFYPALAVISCDCSKDCCGCHAMVHNARFLQNATPPSVHIRSFWIFTEETRQIVPPYNKAGISNFLLRIPEISEIPDFFKTLLLLQFLFDHSELFTKEARHTVPPCYKAGISNFCLEFQKLQKFQISSKRYSSVSSYSNRSFWTFYWRN